MYDYHRKEEVEIRIKNKDFNSLLSSETIALDTIINYFEEDQLPPEVKIDFNTIYCDGLVLNEDLIEKKQEQIEYCLDLNEIENDIFTLVEEHLQNNGYLETLDKRRLEII